MCDRLARDHPLAMVAGRRSLAELETAATAYEEAAATRQRHRAGKHLEYEEQAVQILLLLVHAYLQARDEQQMQTTGKLLLILHRGTSLGIDHNAQMLLHVAESFHKRRDTEQEFPGLVQAYRLYGNSSHRSSHLLAFVHSRLRKLPRTNASKKKNVSENCYVFSTTLRTLEREGEWKWHYTQQMFIHTDRSWETIGECPFTGRLTLSLAQSKSVVSFGQHPCPYGHSSNPRSSTTAFMVSVTSR